MRAAFKKYFIPQAENNFKPPILHPKRVAFYSALGIFMKVVVVGFVILLPAEVFVLPDVLAEQHAKLVALTNDLRAQKGVPPLEASGLLTVSADRKAQDMAEHAYFSHVGPNNRSLTYFLSSAGYRYRVAGENLAMGFSDAESVVNAWIKSPTHYANLVDPEFLELGIGVEGGFYNGYATVYVAQHFGNPLTVASPAPVKANPKKGSVATSAEPKSIVRTRVKGEKLGGEEAVNIVFDRETSEVQWREDGNSTILRARANITGPVQEAIVYVNGYPIEITSKNKNNWYTGQLLVNESAEDLFRTIITPAIVITDLNGQIIKDTIEWKEVKIVSKTPWEKYLQAKKVLAPLTSLFSISRGMYLGLLVFFSLALLINILVEIRKQHYQMIAQTLGMIALFAWLYWM